MSYTLKATSTEVLTEYTRAFSACSEQPGQPILLSFPVYTSPHVIEAREDLQIYVTAHPEYARNVIVAFASAKTDIIKLPSNDDLNLIMAIESLDISFADKQQPEAPEAAEVDTDAMLRLDNTIEELTESVNQLSAILEANNYKGN
jgi:hypothetical protein